MTNKAAIYCRLSEEDKNKQDRQQESNSIRNQKIMLTAYAMEQGWEIYQIYSDDDFKGSDRSRPAFNQMIADAQARKFQIVLCKTQSRFTRELEVVEQYLHHLFPEWGIRFVSIVDHIDTALDGNKKARQINGLVNEWYLEDMSASIKAALHSRMKEGWFIGATAPYGYRKDPDCHGHLLIDEHAAQVVRDIYRLYIQGVGRTRIARILNENGVPSPSAYHAGKQTGVYWKYDTVSRILQNEVYIGNLVQGKTCHPTYKSKHSIPTSPQSWIRTEHTHDPIIDMPTWELTRQLWHEKTRPSYTGQNSPFSGTMICAECGGHMGVAYNHHQRYFRCNNAKYGKTCCKGMTIFQSTLEKAVLEEFRGLEKQYLEQAYLSARYPRPCPKDTHDSLRSLQKKQSELKTALKNLYLDKLKERISPAQFGELSKTLREEENACSLRLSQLQAKEQTSSSVQTALPFHTITREWVKLMIQRIEVGGTKADRKITIYWNF